MVKNKFSRVCIFFAVMLAGQAFGEEGTLINGLDSNYPPFTYTDKTGKLTGFDVEVLNRVAREIGMSVTHQPTEWNGIIDSLLSGEIDIIASGMTISEERAKKVAFSKPYWRIKQVVVVKKNTQISVEEIIAGKKSIGALKESPVRKWLNKRNTQKGCNMDIRIYDSAPLLVEAVLNGNIDAAVTESTSAKDFARKKPIQILSNFGLPEAKFGYAVRKNDQALLKKINKALSKLMVTPFWGELLQKYELSE